MDLLRQALGPTLVDDFLWGAREAGESYLPGDEDLTFGFVQRVLARLRQADRSRGLLFPKFDVDYNRLFDYVDGDGGIWVLQATDLPVDPTWFVEQEVGDPDRTYHALTPGSAEAVVTAFLTALAAKKAALPASRTAPPHQV